MIALESPRLVIREAQADDLPGLLPVYLSNPEFVAMSEGSAGESGRYDLAMLQRDWHVQTTVLGAAMLGIYLKGTNEPVGMAGYLAENPSDGYPWLGLLMIHADHQHQGLGTEAYRRLVEYFRADLGWTTLRLGVLRDNAPARAFWDRLGFRHVRDATNSDGHLVHVLECQL